MLLGIALISDYLGHVATKDLTLKLFPGVDMGFEI